MNSKKLPFYGLLMLFSLLGNAQNLDSNKKNTSNENRFYVSWGWNRGYFTDSDIHFKGEGYDFQLKNVVAKDRQPPFSWGEYFNIEKLTYPQTNFNLGYWIRDKYLLALGVDHMKYVVQLYQTATIDGVISIQNKYDGIYQNELITIQPDLVRLEHTDGLNYINVGLSRTDNLLKSFSSLNDKLELMLIEGISIGALVPRTEAFILNKEERDKYKLSGFGVSFNAGLKVIIYKNYFLRAEVNGGYINLTDIQTSPDVSDRANQDFYFASPSIQFGGIFFLKKK